MASILRDLPQSDRDGFLTMRPATNALPSVRDTRLSASGGRLPPSGSADGQRGLGTTRYRHQLPHLRSLSATPATRQVHPCVTGRQRFRFSQLANAHDAARFLTRSPNEVHYKIKPAN